MPPRCGALKRDIAAKAFDLGFAAVGVAGVEPLIEWQREVDRRISEGLISAEDWRRRKLRFDPRHIASGATSVFVLVRAHAPHLLPFPHGVAGYSAHYREYPKGLSATRELADWLANMGIGTIPQPRLPSKTLAVLAGVGSYGRNSLVQCGEPGSFVTLHTILTDARVEPDEPAPLSECGDCDACMRACPVGALGPSGVLDMRRCIRAYMGSGRLVPPGLRRAYRTDILGCDACQRCCQRNASALRRQRPPSGDDLALFSLAGLLADSPAALKTRLREIGGILGTNYARPNRVLADAAIAAGNTNDPALLEPLAHALEHPHPPVRAHSAWAIGEIGSGAGRSVLLSALARETSPLVKDEITGAVARLS